MTTVINTGFIDNPYRQFDYEIEPGQIQTVRYVHNTVEVIANNQPGHLRINFGGSGGFTEFEQGMIYSYPGGQSIPYIQLQNTSENVMNVTVVLAIGEFKDQRLNISGMVNVQSSVDNPVYVTSTTDNPVYTNPTQFNTCNISVLTIASGVASYTPSAGTKKILIQNSGTADIRIMASNGFIVNPMGTFEINYSGTINIYGTNGQTVIVGVFE